MTDVAMSDVIGVSEPPDRHRSLRATLWAVDLAIRCQMSRQATLAGCHPACVAPADPWQDRPGAPIHPTLIHPMAQGGSAAGRIRSAHKVAGPDSWQAQPGGRTRTPGGLAVMRP
jgi:hypothetical protein